MRITAEKYAQQFIAHAQSNLNAKPILQSYESAENHKNTPNNITYVPACPSELYTPQTHTYRHIV